MGVDVQNSFVIKDHRLQITCSKCGTPDDISVAGGLNPQFVAKRFRMRGWEFDAEDKNHNICPACLKGGREERMAKHQESTIVGSAIDMKPLLSGHAIHNEITLAITPSLRHAGGYALTVEVPALLFTPTFCMITAHEDAGIAIISAPSGGIPSVGSGRTKKFIFEAGVVPFQLHGHTPPIKVDAEIRKMALTVARLPDDLLPLPMRIQKSEVVPMLRPAPTPQSEAVTPPADPFEGLTKIKVGISLMKTGTLAKPTRSVAIGLRSAIIGELVRCAVEPEGKGVKLTLGAEGDPGNKFSINPEYPDAARVTYSGRSWIFEPPDAPFRTIEVQGFIDNTKPHIIHVPFLPPLLKPKGDAAVQAEAPPAFVALGTLDPIKKAKARELLQKHFVERDGEYTDDFCDEEVAAQSGLSVAAIIALREAAYSALNPKYAELYRLLGDRVRLNNAIRSEKGRLNVQR